MSSELAATYTNYASLDPPRGSGASLLGLMAKSRHHKAENLRRYCKPSPQAICDSTAGPGTDAGQQVL
ncbi:hypothetical protein ACTD5D_40765 [Nocardia takedensis]|uniref:hypothetical protein n=1 Tax=Nocardia takedensis TaxID=259390 RepID=UPI003F75AC00